MKQPGPPPASLRYRQAQRPDADGRPRQRHLIPKEGTYVLVCFLPDAKDGKPHFGHGTVQELQLGSVPAPR